MHETCVGLHRFRPPTSAISAGVRELGRTNGRKVGTRYQRHGRRHKSPSVFWVISDDRAPARPSFTLDDADDVARFIDVLERWLARQATWFFTLAPASRGIAFEKIASPFPALCLESFINGAWFDRFTRAIEKRILWVSADKDRSLKKEGGWTHNTHLSIK